MHTLKQPGRQGQGGAMAPYLTLALLFVAAISPQAARADALNRQAAIAPGFTSEHQLCAAVQTAALHCTQAQLSVAAARRLLTALAGVELPASPVGHAVELAVCAAARDCRQVEFCAADHRWPATASRAP